jgi:hypothetical protein
MEAVRQYQLAHNDRQPSAQGVNRFTATAQFLYLVTLEMPWDKNDFPRAVVAEKLPVVPSRDETGRVRCSSAPRW